MSATALPSFRQQLHNYLTCSLGMQEMLALSSFMTGGPMGDVTALFREAFYRYNSANALQPKACVRLATRSMLLLSEYSKQHGLYAEAHSALMKAQSQVSSILHP